MDQSSYLAAAIAPMAVVTYIPRVLPLVLVRGRIQSTFVRSFLYYVPYAVLSGMTIPAIFSATSTPVSATAGLLVAVGLGLYIAYNLTTRNLGGTIHCESTPGQGSRFVIDLPYTPALDERRD